MSMRKLRYLLAGILLVGLVAAGSRWYYVITRPDYRLREGEEALRLGDFKQVDRLIWRLEADGYAAHAHLLRGEVLLRRKDNAHAVAEFRQIPQEQEDLYLKAAPLYGEAVLPINRFEAEAAFLYVLSKQPDDVAAHRGLAEIYRKQQALLRARSHLLELVRLDPDDGRTYLYLAQIDIAYERFDEGRDHLDLALARALSPKEAEKARQDLVQCLFERREYDRVLKVLETCQSATLQDPEIQRLRVESLRAKGRGSESRQLLDRALAGSPRSVSLLRLRGQIHLIDQQPEEAAVVLKRALEIDPHDRECHHELGNAYQRLHQADKAATEFRIAEEISTRLTAIDQLGREALRNPWDAAVRRRLAAQLRELGREDMAKVWEKTAAACPPIAEGHTPWP